MLFVIMVLFCKYKKEFVSDGNDYKQQPTNKEQANSRLALCFELLGRETQYPTAMISNTNLLPLGDDYGVGYAFVGKFV